MTVGLATKSSPLSGIDQRLIGPFHDGIHDPLLPDLLEGRRLDAVATIHRTLAVAPHRQLGVFVSTCAPGALAFCLSIALSPSAATHRRTGGPLMTRPYGLFGKFVNFLSWFGQALTRYGGDVV